MQLKILFAFCLTGVVCMSPAFGQNTKWDAATMEAMKSIARPEQRANMLKQYFGVSVDQSWPTNFPVPKYTSNVVQSNFEHSTKGAPTAVAMIITKDEPKTVFDFYNAACSRAGWTVKMPSEKALAQINKGGNQYILNASQGRQAMFITCSRHRKTNGTVVSISWQMRPK